MRSNVLFLLTVGLCIVSCDSNRVFDTYKSVSSAWDKDDIVSFKIQDLDALQKHHLFVNLRTTNDYKYNNIFLIVNMSFPHGKTITDTLEYRMAKPTGELLGTGMIGVKEHKLWYKEDVVFNEEGVYNVDIKHAMRENGKVNGVIKLEGVTEVGFRIEKAN